jgi:hypothetical protein
MDKLTKEIRNTLIDKIVKSHELSSAEIADSVALYYDAQELRIGWANKRRTEHPEEPAPEDVITSEQAEALPMRSWFHYWLNAGERVIYAKLADWIKSAESPVEAKWAYSQIGIGPIIAAGLAAHIDVTRAEHVSSLWKFAGLAPGFDRRQKGVKLPYNARLKVLCFKLGESFVKVSGKDGATYGHLYAQFKKEEINRNEAGFYREAAKRELAGKTFKNDNATRKRLMEGKLSDAHLHARAKRRTVKLFLSHLWVRAREARGLPVSDPYSIGILKHDGKIEPSATRNPNPSSEPKRGRKTSR